MKKITLTVLIESFYRLANHAGFLKNINIGKTLSLYVKFLVSDVENIRNFAASCCVRICDGEIKNALIKQICAEMESKIEGYQRVSIQWS